MAYHDSATSPPSKRRLLTLPDVVLAAVAVAAVLGILVPGTAGHGRLMDPPSRSSLWRFGLKSPVNYDDNQLFCGGFSTQWGQYGGKCGLCGDPWPGPRENEPGGKYATGIISRSYTQGQVMEVYVQLTANHRGYFEFRLCQHDNALTNITQQCLDQHVLVLDSTGQTRYSVPPGGYQSTQDLRIKLRLPPNLRCKACVLQWKYNAGNSWGVDPVTKRGCVGCGPQEQFYGCADVAIGHGEVVTGVPPDSFPGNTLKPSVKTTRSSMTTARPGEGVSATSGGVVMTTVLKEKEEEGKDGELHFGIADVFGSAGGKAPASASASVFQPCFVSVNVAVMLLCWWAGVFFSP